MRCVVVLSGDIRDDRTARSLLDAADLVICADGGARHLKRLGRLPDLLVGDMDSAAPADLQWIVDRQVPVDRHPAEKDETDAELALLAAVERLPEPRQEQELVVLGAFGSRPDHVLANQLLAARLAAQGWRLLLTDGVSRLHTLVGGQVLHLDLPPQAGSGWVLSAIPVTATAAGLTYEGLVYPLDQAVLELGSTRGVSNHFQGDRPAVARLARGTVLILVTPED